MLYNTPFTDSQNRDFVLVYSLLSVSDCLALLIFLAVLPLHLSEIPASEMVFAKVINNRAQYDLTILW